MFARRRLELPHRVTVARGGQVAALLDKPSGAIPAQDLDNPGWRATKAEGGMTHYDSDILVWSERQGALLRRRAAGELVNDRELDWPNIAEEIESVGRSQLSAVRSFIIQALAHDLKAEAWSNSQAVPGWRAEAVRFRQEAAEAFVPSMRQHIDMAKLFALAVRRLPAMIDGQAPLPVSPTCPVTLDELLESGD
jgi:hypothetical protein